jgi:hypothetical protein
MQEFSQTDCPLFGKRIQGQTSASLRRGERKIKKLRKEPACRQAGCALLFLPFLSFLPFLPSILALHFFYFRTYGT